MTKIPLPYYGNKMMFSIASNWSFGHLWSSCVDHDKSFPKTYYMPPLQIQSLAIWSPSNDLDFSYGNQRWTKFLVNFWSPFGHFGEWELSKNILHAPFPNSVASDWKISIVIQ
jgi:hypothetical protein